MKVQSDQEPIRLEKTKSGWKYRWNITSKEVADNFNQTSRTSWMWDEITLFNTPTSNSVTSAVINEMWGTTEAKLLNDYNAAKEGILGSEKIQAYLDFLEVRKLVKLEIEDFFNIRQNG